MTKAAAIARNAARSFKFRNRETGPVEFVSGHSAAAIYRVGRDRVTVSRDGQTNGTPNQRRAIEAHLTSTHNEASRWARRYGYPEPIFPHTLPLK